VIVPFVDIGGIDYHHFSFLMQYIIDRWFSRGTRVSFTNITDHQDVTEILLKVALNTINLALYLLFILQ
jgi:hypothetical protein